MRPVPAAPTTRAASRRLFGLAPDGVFRADDITADAVSSYLAISPLPERLSPSLAVCFLWHCPSINHYADGPRLHEASRPAESGLSSIPIPQLRDETAAIRPSKLESKIKPRTLPGLYSACQYRMRPQYSQLVNSSPCLASWTTCGGMCK